MPVSLNLFHITHDSGFLDILPNPIKGLNLSQLTYNIDMALVAFSNEIKGYCDKDGNASVEINIAGHGAWKNAGISTNYSKYIYKYTEGATLVKKIYDASIGCDQVNIKLLSCNGAYKATKVYCDFLKKFNKEDSKIISIEGCANKAQLIALKDRISFEYDEGFYDVPKDSFWEGVGMISVNSPTTKVPCNAYLSWNVKEQIEQTFFSCSIDTVPEIEECAIPEDVNTNPVESVLMLGAMAMMVDVV